MNSKRHDDADDRRDSHTSDADEGAEQDSIPLADEPSPSDRPAADASQTQGGDRHGDAPAGDADGETIPLADTQTAPEAPQPTPDKPRDASAGDAEAGETIPLAEPAPAPAKPERPPKKPSSSDRPKRSSESSSSTTSDKRSSSRSSRSSSRPTSSAATATPEAPAEREAPPEGDGKKPGRKPQAPEDPVHCHNHPEALGKWFCEICNGPVCRECVQIVEDRRAGRPVAYCLKCDKPAKINKAARHQEEYDTSPFPARVAAGLTYPLRGPGPVIVLLSAALVGILLYAGTQNMLIPTFLLPVVSVWFVPWLMDILRESARGARAMPTPPGFVDAQSEMIVPLGLFLCAAIVCFAPAAIVQFLLGEGGVTAILAPVLWGAGLVLLPVTLMVVMLFETPLAIRPGIIAAALSTLGGDYLLFLAIYAIAPVIIFLGITYLEDPVVVIAVCVPVGVYFAAVSAHLLGQLYHARRNDLAWFA